MKEGDKIIKALFELAAKKRPSVIFIDELELLLGRRYEEEYESRRLKTELLIQMQMNKEKNIIVLGTSNAYWGLAPAVKRRFQDKILLSLPEFDERKLMFKINLKNTKNDLVDEQFEILSQLAKGYSGADIYSITKEAINEPIKKCQRANYFKYLDNKYITPCAPSDPLAKKMKINDIDPKYLVYPLVTFEDFIIQIQKSEPSVKPDDRCLCIGLGHFTKEFGTEG